MHAQARACSCIRVYARISAASKPERAPLRPAPRLVPARQLIKKRKKQVWTKRHADAVRQAVLGGPPSQEAMFVGGRARGPACQLRTKGHGTLQHYWKCSSDLRAQAPQEPTAHDADISFRDISHLGASASSSCLSRLL